MNCTDQTGRSAEEPVKQYKGIIFTDFDGTLYHKETQIHPDNFAALLKARSEGFLTVINTGRSLYSFHRVMERLENRLSEYFDYVIFSSGAGILKLPEDRIIESINLDESSASEAAGLFFRRGIDFMIQKSVPLNHHFTHVKSNGSLNPDFYRRIRIYEDFAEPLRKESASEDNMSDLDLIEKICSSGVSQLVAVIPPSAGNDEKYAEELISYLRQRLSGCTVVRTTSPIDHKSLWVEIFSPEVSKAKTAKRLAAGYNLSNSRAMAIGNDFNDEDMLHWAGYSYTVEEAPQLLKDLHPPAGSCAEGAVANAINLFIEAISKQ